MMVLLFCFALALLLLLVRMNSVQKTRVMSRANTYLGIYSQRNQNLKQKRSNWWYTWTTKAKKSAVLLPILAAFATVYFVSGSIHIVVGVLMAGVVFVVTRKVVINRERQKRLDKIEHDLPQAIDVFARAVAAGVPLDRAILSVSNAFDGPLGDEFERLYHALVLGVPLQQALSDASKRVESGGFQYFTAILSLNAETGGPLVEVLSNLSTGLRDRQKLEKRVLALTAEPRTAAKVVTGIPVALIALQFVKQPEQVEFLLTDPAGQNITLYAVVSITLGLLIIQRLTKIG